MGVDANVFRSQTTSFRELLPNSYDFTFLDGPVLCDPSPDASDFYAGPYRSWFNTPSREKVQKAHNYVLKVVREAKGFDMVMGFSQGAALAASLILHHQMEHPDSPSLFKAAIFICSPLPFSRSLEHGIDVRSYFGISPAPPLSTRRPRTVPDYLVAEAYFLRNDKDLGEAPTHNAAILTSGFEAADGKAGSSDIGGPFYNIFHPNVDSARIKIPTGHIYGNLDSWRRHSMDLVELCETDKSVTFKHDGGHEIPRGVSEELCDLFEEVVAKAGLWSWIQRFW
jgi:pimeloyl-ACP methyl ester carboxylesterase